MCRLLTCSGICIGNLNHLFLWPEPYRRTGELSISFLSDEIRSFASVGLGGAAVGGALSIPDRTVGLRWQPGADKRRDEELCVA